jgi:hypothetical protein
MFKNSYSWLADQVVDNLKATTKMKYKRGTDADVEGVNLLNLDVVWNETEFEVERDNEAYARYEHREFLFKYTDLQFSSQQTLPQRGDVIKEDIGDKIYTWVVLPNAEGEFYTEALDRNLLRVFCVCFEKVND